MSEPRCNFELLINYILAYFSLNDLKVYEIHCHLGMPRDQTNLYIFFILPGGLRMQKPMVEARICPRYRKRVMVPGDVLVSDFNSCMSAEAWCSCVASLLMTSQLCFVSKGRLFRTDNDQSTLVWAILFHFASVGWRVDMAQFWSMGYKEQVFFYVKKKKNQNLKILSIPSGKRVWCFSFSRPPEIMRWHRQGQKYDALTVMEQMTQ